MDCYLLPPTAAGDVIRGRVVVTSGNINPIIEVVRPLGETCGATFGEMECTSTDAGASALLVYEGFGNTATGGYSAHVQRLTPPTNCGALVIGSSNQDLSVPGETDCFVVALAEGDEVRIAQPTPPASSFPPWRSATTSPGWCAAGEPAPLRGARQRCILRSGLRSPEPAPGRSLRLNVDCLTPPCGPGRFGAASITPSRAGNTGTTTASVVGKGFTDGLEVTLVSEGQPDIVGQVGSISDNRRNITVTFDLAGQAHGPRDVVVRLTDGSVATIARAFTIEPARPAEFSVTSSAGTPSAPDCPSLTAWS